MRRIRRPKGKESYTQTAQSAVEGFLGLLNFDPSLYPAFELWDKETRPYVRGCQAVAIQGTKLCVHVPSAVHRQELMYHKDRVLSRVNQALGRKAITDIQFEFEKGGHA